MVEKFIEQKCRTLTKLGSTWHGLLLALLSCELQDAEIRLHKAIVLYWLTSAYPLRILKQVSLVSFWEEELGESVVLGVILVVELVLNRTGIYRGCKESLNLNLSNMKLCLLPKKIFLHLVQHQNCKSKTTTANF